MSDDQLYQALTEDIVALEERVDELEAKLARVGQLADRVDELDARTDIMQLVEDSDDLSGRGRSIRLLQHMQRKANRQDLSKIALTKDQAAEALHYPDLDRTTYYTDLRRCARLIGDRDICWYETDDEGNLEEACVVLDYEQFQLAASAGEVSPDVVNSTASNGGA